MLTEMTVLTDIPCDDIRVVDWLSAECPAFLNFLRHNGIQYFDVHYQSDAPRFVIAPNFSTRTWRFRLAGLWRWLKAVPPAPLELIDSTDRRVNFPDPIKVLDGQPPQWLIDHYRNQEYC